MSSEIKDFSRVARDIEENISSFFIGKKEQIRFMLTGFLSGLHVLIEDIPGVGKTTLAKALAASVGLSFSRIQFTPDLLPGDILGMSTWDHEKREFLFKKGAILSQFVLADEINRASPRTQSSLLEAMEEETLSVDGKSFDLPQPFFVIATQNPETFTGTFPLPEAELDRFGLCFSLGYATNQEEFEILGMNKYAHPFNSLKAVVDSEKIISLRRAVAEFTVSDHVKHYIIAISNKIRSSKYVRLGVSTRALRHLVTASRAQALLEERDFVIPEDIMKLLVPVLAHRIILSTEAHMERKSSSQLLKDLIATIPVPTGRS
ncbi:MAG: MoxR family ATPase [Spirochaetales bacterium]|nr:MoxR family ATPase [Spirochaetales bacterium]